MSRVGLVSRNRVRNRTEIRIKATARARLESGLPFYIRIHASTPSQGPARPGTGPSHALLPFTPTQPWRVTPTLTLSRATETQAQLHPQPRLGLVDSQANKVG